MLRVLIAALLLSMAAVHASSIETYRFETPEREALYKKMIAELRCLVCQNQNLADSNAELAVDLRRKTYEMVSAGKSEQEIMTYMVARYGDFVLYRPPMKSITFFLWTGPFIILGVGVFILFRVIRKKSAKTTDESLSEEQRAKAQDLLKGDNE